MSTFEESHRVGDARMVLPEDPTLVANLRETLKDDALKLASGKLGNLQPLYICRIAIAEGLLNTKNVSLNDMTDALKQTTSEIRDVDVDNAWGIIRSLTANGAGGSIETP